MDLGRDAKITLREITAETLRSILQLEVSEAQKGFVTNNAVSIAQAHFSKHAWFRAIYADDTPVGFVMLYLDKENSIYEVWRFMVDQNHQGKGYARHAMSQLIQYVQALPGAKELYLSYIPGEGNALPFYRKMDFEETGEWADNEKVMKLVLT